MTAIIKARSTHILVRAFPTVGGRPAVIETAQSRVEAGLSAARAEIAGLHAALAAAKGDAGAAVKRAQEIGHAAGIAAADTQQAQRLDAIERGVAEARRAWDDRLAGLDALAASLSRAALRKLFEPDADLADLTVRAIARQMTRLSDETVVAIRVNSTDFGQAALETLRGKHAIDIVADATLASGECRFDLMLGGREVGPIAQWTVLARFLDDMADSADA